MIEAFGNLFGAFLAILLKAVLVVIGVWMAIWFAAYLPWPEIPTFAQTTLCPNSWR